MAAFLVFRERACRTPDGDNKLLLDMEDVDLIDQAAARMVRRTTEVEVTCGLRLKVPEPNSQLVGRESPAGTPPGASSSVQIAEISIDVLFPAWDESHLLCLGRPSSAKSGRNHGQRRRRSSWSDTGEQLQRPQCVLLTLNLLGEMFICTPRGCALG